jgi:hypothetical protein
MVMLDTESVMGQMIAALQVLAADPRDQMHAFPRYVAVADEIALMLHEAVLLFEQEIDNEDLPQWLLLPAKELDATMDLLSGQKEASFWSDESLASDIRWQRLRLTSRNLLERLGVARAIPSLQQAYAPADNLE